MRKYLKTRCLKALSVLNEAHGEIENLIDKKQYEIAIDLLAQCQQGAIKVGEIIESSEGEGTDEVHQLEAYCEMVYHLTEELSPGKSVIGRKAVKNLRKPIQKVSRGIRDVFPTRREVVFLPYKASMWDSLESVWKEMDEDPDVDALVMPIPYFDKNPDGSFAQPHWEADQFPEGIPITDYRNYDLADRHPDAIYIHNPYDEANFVTSIHPDFYSSKIKEYTDELVYIPYFILGDIDPNNKKAEKEVAHFITLPGVVHAHRVIVQSEDWRRVYVDVMTDLAGEESRPYWESKIESGVSPKIQRIRSLKRSDFVLPDDWEKLITKPDGSRKKLIFYNTSVGALLQEDDKMIDKILRVFEIFRENADDVILLWRPHPLIEATLTSMRPELWERYKTIVDEYRSAGWGIYDDSPDIDRAIIVSDAYYGDMSSVVWMYKETGKPVMVQNVNV